MPHVLLDSLGARTVVPATLEPAFRQPDRDLGMDRAPGETGVAGNFTVGDGRPVAGLYALTGRVYRSTSDLLRSELDALAAAVQTAVTLVWEDKGSEVWRRPVDTGAFSRGHVVESPQGVGRSNAVNVTLELALARLDDPTAGPADQADTGPLVTIA